MSYVPGTERGNPCLVCLGLWSDPNPIVLVVFLSCTSQISQLPFFQRFLTAIDHSYLRKPLGLGSARN